MEHGSDICYCGDYRSQHKPKCFCGCQAFKFSRKANAADMEIWDKYHANRCFNGTPGCDCYGTFQRLVSQGERVLSRVVGCRKRTELER